MNFVEERKADEILEREERRRNFWERLFGFLSSPKISFLHLSHCKRSKNHLSGRR